MEQNNKRNELANAFGSTFEFFPNAKTKQKNAKELPSQRTKDTGNNGQQSNDRQVE
jgi:hypothetical protein